MSAEEPFGSQAAAWAALGYEPLPLAGKRPMFNDWQHFDPERLPTLIHVNPGANIGIATRGLAVLDCDVLDADVARHMRVFLQRYLEPDRPLLFRVGKAPKWLCLLRCAEGEAPKRSSALYEDAQGRQHRLEWLRTGQQFLAHGVHPDTRKPMHWPRGDAVTAHARRDELPAVSDEQIDAINAEFDRVAALAGWRRISGAQAASAADDAPAPAPVDGLDLETARAALEAYGNDNLHYDEWLGVGMALHHQFDGAVEAFELWDEWSATAGKYGGGEYGWKRWESFNAERPGGVSMRSVLQAAELAGWQRPPGVEQAPAAVDDFPDLSQFSDLPESDPQHSLDDPTTDAADFFPGAFRVPPDLDPASIPRRNWVIPGRLLAGHVSLLVGPPGTSKSVFDLTRAISLVADQALLDEQIVRPGAVIVVNNEDPRDEIERRIIAIAARHAIPLDRLAHLHVISGYERPVKFAELHGDRRASYLRPTQDATRLIRFAQAVGAVALVVDPLISTVRGGEENSNDRMEELISIWKRIAAQTGAAVSITHHTSKTGRDSEAHAGNMEAARGASALVGAVRMAFTLARMSPENGAARGLPRSVSKSLVRLDSAKQNYWVPDDAATWFHLESVAIGNGEEAGVPVHCILEDMQEEYADAEGTSIEFQEIRLRREAVLAMFEREMSRGETSWSLKRVAERWMGRAGVQYRQAREQIKQIIPEGGYGHAVRVERDGQAQWLWREMLGDGNGARHSVHACLSSDNDDWID